MVGSLYPWYYFAGWVHLLRPINRYHYPWFTCHLLTHPSRLADRSVLAAPAESTKRTKLAPGVSGSPSSTTAGESPGLDEYMIWSAMRIPSTNSSWCLLPANSATMFNLVNFIMNTGCNQIGKLSTFLFGLQYSITIRMFLIVKTGQGLHAMKGKTNWLHIHYTAAGPSMPSTLTSLYGTKDDFSASAREYHDCLYVSTNCPTYLFVTFNS